MTKYNYDGIKALANKLGRPASTLIALAPDNDPFYILPFRQEAAMWFADLWERLGTGAGTHLRRFHYLLISQKTPILQVNGRPYKNTTDCWLELGSSSRDARYMGLVPVEFHAAATMLRSSTSRTRPILMP